MTLARSASAMLLLLVSLVFALKAAGTEAEEMWVFTTFAGISPGDDDGVGSAARFYNPTGVAVDASGNIVVVDRGNRAIRKISPSGFVSTFVRSSTSSLAYPNELAIDAAGYIFVVDGVTIRRVSPGGDVWLCAGYPGQSGIFDGTSARFEYPNAIAIDKSGALFVTDEHTIRKVIPGFAVVTIAGKAHTSGSTDGTGSAARFNYPTDIAVDANGDLYVADAYNCTIRKVTQSGVVTTVAGVASECSTIDGDTTAARFGGPEAVVVDSAGILYVAERSGVIRRVSKEGLVTTIAGRVGQVGGDDGIGSAASFNRLVRLAIDPQGNLIACDAGGATIRRVTPTGEVTTIAGLAGYGANDGGPGVARFAAPHDIEVDKDGNVMVLDVANDNVRKITPLGEVSTIATVPRGQDNSTERSLASAGSGDLLISYYGDHTIARVAPNGELSHFAGVTGERGGEDGPGTAARFYHPDGIAVDGSGNVIVADSHGSTIRKITPTGTVSTLAGMFSFYGIRDGSGSLARFGQPHALTVAPSGDVFVGDSSTIRRVTAAGEVTTVAGGLNGTRGIGADRAGNLFVTGLWTVLEISPAGKLKTIAGKGDYYYGWNNGAGSTVRFLSPNGIAVDANGAIYVADAGTRTIRRGVRCVSGALCPQSGRFQLTLSARDSRTGAIGVGVPTQENDLFGYFSIPALTGNEKNPEVFVKLLDGRVVNGNFWVFYGGLTDLEYTLTVRDTVTGVTKSYTKGPGSAAGGFDAGGGVEAEECAGEVEGTLQAPVAPALCSTGSDHLCLGAGRFLVELTARDPRADATGTGVTIPHGDLFGYFAIPGLTGSTSNPEVFVKVIDGRAVNGRHWLFFSGLTDMEYTLTVTDTATGTRKSYLKQAGSACGAFDTDAF